MGSFVWDNPCYYQYHNGRPLSVALTEPYETEIAACIESDFASPFHCRPRSQSSGRRYKQESYRIYHPNVQYASYYYSPPFSPPFSRRLIDRSASGDYFVEKLETVVVENQQCRPNYGYTPCACAPPVRQVKIRSRPSSCVDFRKKETENQWTKVIEERRDEKYDYHYDYTIPIQRELSPRVYRHDETTTTTDLHIPVAKPVVRPSTKDVATTTDGLPSSRKPIRPLSISETQVLDRYETKEKIRRDSIEEATGTIIYTSTSDRPLHRYYEHRSYDNTDFDDSQYKQASTKAHRKEFVQRMRARNGGAGALRSYNTANLYSDYGRNQMIIRPTARPREALVDTPAIVAPPSEYEALRPIATSETHISSRNYYQHT